MGELTICSHSSEPFDSREQAGQLLAAELSERLQHATHGLPKTSEHPGQDVVVLGVPRGGIIVGREVAERLSAPLDIVLTRKIGAPGYPEAAIGAITEDGKVFVNEETAARVGAGQQYIESERQAVLAEIARRARLCRRVRPKAPVAGKVAVLTDDGVATGATMQAAIWAVRQEQPALVVVALPVGPADSIQKLARDADELICLRCPPHFQAVGQFYRHFEQVEDRALLEVLAQEAKRGAHV